MRKLILGGGLLAASSLLLGCPNPNTYGTPRTVQKGQISHTVALEGAYWSYDKLTTRTTGGVSTTTRESTGVGFPLLPSYQLRYGISDNMDFGVGVKNLSSLQGDFKFNFLKSESFDLAIDPGLQYFGVFGGNGGSLHVFWLHLPLIAGINLSDSFSVVAHAGVVGLVVAGTNSSGNTDAYNGNGALFRGGLGINIRTGKDFAIQPEVSVMRAFNDAQSLFFTGGLGFTFGKHSHFKDQAPPGGMPGTAPGTAPATPPPAGSPPPAGNPPPPPPSVTQ